MSDAVAQFANAKYFSLAPEDTERLERALDDGERIGAAV